MIATSRTKPSTAYSGGAPATIATAAAAMATMMGSTWPMLEITAGWPAYRSFSTSASLVAAKALRSVLQKRHLMATALMASPHTGQGLVSTSMIAPLQLSYTPFAGRRQMRFLMPHKFLLWGGPLDGLRVSASPGSGQPPSLLALPSPSHIPSGAKRRISSSCRFCGADLALAGRAAPPVYQNHDFRRPPGLRNRDVFQNHPQHPALQAAGLTGGPERHPAPVRRRQSVHRNLRRGQPPYDRGHRRPAGRSR